MILRYTRPEMGELWSTTRRFATWLEVEVAAVRAMEEIGLVPAGTGEAIARRARVDPERIDAIEAVVHHDVIAFLTQVGESLGEEKRYLHQGMTSSDLLDTALALTLTRAGKLISAGVVRIGRRLRSLAEEHRETVMIGRTHGVHAEPITFGHKALVWFAEFERQDQRLSAALEDVRVGKFSGAVGTFAHLPPEVEARACARLGLRPDPATTQVISRDRHAHLVAALALIGASCEKIAVEIRHLQRTEVAEAFEPFARGQKGSSAMPHKRNPILCERVTGLARLLRSYVGVAYENVALWHERDISHSSAERVLLPDAFIALDYQLEILARVLEGLEIDPARMRANLEASRGLYFSQGALLELTRRLGSREEAYALVQEAAMEAWRDQRPFRETLSERARAAALTPAELDRICDVSRFLGNLEPVFVRVLASTWARGGEAAGGSARREAGGDG